MSFENLGPGPDIDSIDFSKMEFGNNPGDTAPEPEDDTTPETLEKEFKEANPEPEAKTEPEEVKPEAEEQPRDEKGRFSEKEPRIPKSRFDEQVGKEREAREAAERRAAELERRLNETTAQKEAQAQIDQIETKVEELETKYQELLLDGNTKEAAAVMKQIRHAERQIATAEAESRASVATARALEADRMDASIARLEADHPEFNPDSESYDPDLVALVLSKQRDFINGGMSPSVAMEKAGKSVADRFLKKEAAPENKGLATVKNDDRTKEAVAKALATQKSQPASMKEVGFDSDKAGEKAGLPDVSKMTADEFAALPKATQDRLMGNLV